MKVPLLLWTRSAADGPRQEAAASNTPTRQLHYVTAWTAWRRTFRSGGLRSTSRTSDGGRRLDTMPTVGAHVDSTDPIGAAREVGAQVAQFFLADPQGWKKPTEHPQADALKASGLTIYIHSPYVLNVATLNNRIRIPSRKLLAQHADAAAQIG